jgi:hypothetical protein
VDEVTESKGTLWRLVIGRGASTPAGLSRPLNELNVRKDTYHEPLP